MVLQLALGPIPGLADGSAAPAEYMLHPGDQLTVTVYGEPTLSQNATLMPDGTIAYPLVGELHIGGDTVEVAAQKLTKALRQYVRDPIVSIAIAQLGNYDVLVLGDVKTPGKYSLPSTARLTDAIAAAGGVDDVNGDYPDARVSISNGAPVSVSLQALLRKGDVAKNIPLGNETVVYVPGPTPMQVEVIGSVDKPGTVVIHDGDRLAMAIATAGTTANSQADLSHIRVTRTLPSGDTTATEYNLYSALKDGNQAQDPVLTRNDVVYVPQARPADRISGFFQGMLLVLSRLVIPF
jgi:polysaccharide biosynthesis/export protein